MTDKERMTVARRERVAQLEDERANLVNKLYCVDLLLDMHKEALSEL